ncbi:unnamed protein product [Adineta steineri]|uniref:Uncharacterized protein n=1 Tax=Adineta steineri TaxID=433720 RepID=A0A820F1A9_9BILA|nr:unnamed protein product [Adineta steineri]
MSHKRINIPGAEGYRELLNALEHDGKNIEYITIETIEKINQMLDNDLFSRTNLDSIQSIASKSVVNVPTLNDNTNTYDLVIKCNERLEILVEHVKHKEFLFIENAEKICGLIDLNVMYNNRINYETQLLWKNEIIEMQGQISSNHMDILNYYRNRSEIASNILEEPPKSAMTTGANTDQTQWHTVTCGVHTYTLPTRYQNPVHISQGAFGSVM